MLRIAIVDPSDLTRDPLRSLLLGVDFIWLESECARYEFFAEVISHSVPDLAIVALDADRPKALWTGVKSLGTEVKSQCNGAKSLVTAPVSKLPKRICRYSQQFEFDLERR